MLIDPGPTALETTLASHPDAAAELVLPLIAVPAGPIRSFDDPRVSDRVRWAVERLFIRVLAREASSRASRARADKSDGDELAGRLAG